MKITREQVDYVALLGRLELEPEEKQKYMGQLDDILKYMDMLAEELGLPYEAITKRGPGSELVKKW